MKISNAIRKVESIFSDSPNIVSDEDNESVEFALKAMEKEDPMYAGVLKMNCDCPACGETMEYEHNYCPECGQRLKWTED